MTRLGIAPSDRIALVDASSGTGLAASFAGGAGGAGGGGGAEARTGSPLSQILKPAGPSSCAVTVRGRVDTILRVR